MASDRAQSVWIAGNFYTNPTIGQIILNSPILNESGLYVATIKIFTTTDIDLLFFYSPFSGTAKAHRLSLVGERRIEETFRVEANPGDTFYVTVASLVSPGDVVQASFIY